MDLLSSVLMSIVSNLLDDTGIEKRFCTKGQKIKVSLDLQARTTQDMVSMDKYRHFPQPFQASRNVPSYGRMLAPAALAPKEPNWARPCKRSPPATECARRLPHPS